MKSYPRSIRVNPDLPLRIAWAIALVVLSAGTLTIHGASHYIRSAAEGLGNGNSWANAWTNFNKVNWVRGDTYYVAGGEYPGNANIGRSPAGDLWIVVKKGNQADNALDPGWDPDFASDLAAIRGRLMLSGGYVRLDGVTGTGTKGHGILVHDALAANSTSVITLGSSSSPYKLFHVEAKGAGFGSSSNIFDGIMHNNVTNPQKGTHIAHCWVHEVTRNGLTLGALIGASYEDYGLLLENCFISETGGCLDPQQHGQGMQISYGCGDAFTIIRNNTFRNITGTGNIVWLSGRNSVHRDALIYNNLFYTIDVDKYRICSPGVVYCKNDAEGCYNIAFYNNTIAGIGSAEIRTAYGGFYLDATGATNNLLVNNLWEGCYFGTPHRGFKSQSNNGYFGNSGNFPIGTLNQITSSAAALFDAANGDLRLLPNGLGAKAGLNLAGIFTNDLAGFRRDAVWDLGALKVRPPLAPTNLRIVP